MNLILFVHTFNALKHILKQPENCAQEVYVLLADSLGPFQELFRLIDLFNGRRIEEFWLPVLNNLENNDAQRKRH